MTFTAPEIENIRAGTPGVQQRVHLNNAGAGLMPQPVIDAICGHIQLEAEIGGYEAAAQEHKRCDRVYDSIARLVGAKREEIALMENATVAWQMAFYAQNFKPGDRILTARAEYAANYVAFLQQAKRTGCTISIIPDGPDGASDPSALEQMIDGQVKLIAITHIPTNGGLINPAAQIGRIARQHGIPYLLDACQTAGQMPIDVDALGCDFLTATGRKFLRGPRGTGFLYVRKTMLKTFEPAMIDHFGAAWGSAEEYRLREDARRFETWENAYALRLGLGTAADYALDIGLERIQKRAFFLAKTVREKLSTINDIRLHDLGTEKCAIVSFSHTRTAAEEIRTRTNCNNINISISFPSSTRLDSEARALPSVVRVSPHYYNTESEIDRFIEVLNDMLK